MNQFGTKLKFHLHISQTICLARRLKQWQFLQYLKEMEQAVVVQEPKAVIYLLVLLNNHDG